jgi:hypothetical protein
VSPAGPHRIRFSAVAVRANAHQRRCWSHRGASTDCIRDEACAGGKSQRSLWLGDQRLRCLRPWTDQVSFGHLICDGIIPTADVLASRVSVDFSEGNLLQFF